MRVGLIDVGSNTIRVVVYEYSDKNFKEIVNEKQFCELISYVEENELSEEGVEKLKDCISTMANLCRLLACEEIHCFATASIRNIKNSNEVIQEVEDAAKVKLDIITGEMEAFYDFTGLKELIPDEDAVGFDLGGGSCQIFYYKNKKLQESVSYPLGSLKTYNTFVKGLLPNKKERAKIAKNAKQYLQENKKMALLKLDTLYAMGGSARACARLHKSLTGDSRSIPFYTLNYDELGKMLEILDDFGLNGVKLLNRVLPERTHTIVPAIVTIQTVMNYVGAKKICIVKSGVREGFFIHNILEKKA